MQAVFFWLQERLRDAWLWPLNLVRDFPARSGRLAATIFTGGRALLLAPAGLWHAMHQRTGRQVARQEARQVAKWLHLLLAQLFDLVGGPEICQFVMHLGMDTAPLAAAELTAVQPVFGHSNLRYGDVRVARGGILHLIFRYNGGLAFATWYTIHLPQVEYEAGRTGNGRHRHPLALLVHELTHVFQYHHVGSRYLGEAIYYLVTTRRDCYQYGGAAGLKWSLQQGKKLRQFNREQQAQIIEDYFVKLQTDQDTAAYLPYLAQLRQGEV